MGRMLLLCLLSALLGPGCGRQEAPTGEDATATLRQADHGGFERAYVPRPFDFPADHGPHPDFRDEWWYVTGHLDGSEGRRFGFQITIFRHGLKRGLPTRESAWAAQDAYMAHFAVTDVAGRRFVSFQRVSRGAAGLAGAKAQPLRVWLEDWRIEAAPDNGFPWHLQAEQDGVGLSLDISPLKPIVLQGDHGLSRKSAEAGNASYYYSISRLKVAGTLRLHAQEMPVEGLAWLDREWSTSMLADYQTGWDWFSLQLADGTDLMFIQIRHKDGTADPLSSGTLIGADGATTPLAREDVAIQVLDTWESPKGGRYPARWRLKIKPSGRLLDIRPVLANQELRGNARYWEGAVDIQDAESGAQAGRGYVELTGYGKGLIPQRSSE